MVVYSYSKSSKFTSVVIDDEKGGYDMTRYLISRGHRKIGVIAGTADNMHTRRDAWGTRKHYMKTGYCTIRLDQIWDWQRSRAIRGTAAQ